MIVPMKKVSLVVLKSEKEKTLKKLRRLGLLHIEAMQGSGEKLIKLGEQIKKLESSIALVSDRLEKDTVQLPVGEDEAMKIAESIAALTEEREVCRSEKLLYQAEADRIKAWGDIEPKEFAELANKSIDISLYDMPPSLYEELKQSVNTVVFTADKNSVRFLLVKTEAYKESEPLELSAYEQYQVALPELSTSEIKQKISDIQSRIDDIEKELTASASYIDGLQKAISELQKDVEFENYYTGMDGASLSDSAENTFDVAYFTGYIQTEDAEKLKAAAKENSWGLLLEEPTPDDNVPTKLKNNKFVSLIYPLTNFLGTVPGYFEYDISAWFLGFILVFFGIIFGDGGYGLVICAGMAIPIIISIVNKKPIQPAFLLIMLMGASTIIWGALTCTWFGISPELLPTWLRKISIPFISNVYADKLWYPPWTNGQAALTTTQNVQIVCFALALVQLTVAHAKGMVRNRRSLKLLGDFGSILQLWGIFCVVLSLVVNGEVFTIGMKIAGIPVGTVAIAFIGVGFLTNFIFANYEGSIKESIITNLKNIVSCLLGVINVFSDIVSYIRLWAVGLAGSAISATVNELASPMLGNFLFMIFAIIILVFGHGLNMILNVLSLIVHGVRLNTLEFSSHLDMSWGGHSFKPFEE